MILYEQYQRKITISDTDVELLMKLISFYHMRGNLYNLSEKDCKILSDKLESINKIKYDKMIRFLGECGNLITERQFNYFDFI
jgi:hypothetical protein